MNYWESYNNNLLDLSEELLTHNIENDFNFIETDLYNHVHDILVLSLLLFEKKKEIRILDYGSNIIPWSNISNKIKVDNIKVTIYDPFSNNEKEVQLFDNFKVKILNSKNVLKEKNYEFLIFGSSSQYIKNFIEVLDSNMILNSNLVLFTHTPLSKKENFISNQHSGYKGHQIIRSFKFIKEKMEKNKFELIFKSALPPELASVDKEKTKNTIYSNLLFKRIM